MIVFLKGQLVRALPTVVEMDVNGVGYEVAIPLSTFDKLPTPPAQYKILTYLHVREDMQALFGFATEEERALFLLLVNRVSGIGPKMALNVLGGISVLDFRSAVVNNDVQTLSRVKGLGKKTAEKIILELRDKIGVSAEWEKASQQNSLSPEAQVLRDAVLALIALGYRQAEAHKAAKDAQDRAKGAGTEEIIRDALKLL